MTRPRHGAESIDISWPNGAEKNDISAGRTVQTLKLRLLATTGCHTGIADAISGGAFTSIATTVTTPVKSLGDIDKPRSHGRRFTANITQQLCTRSRKHRANKGKPIPDVR